MKINYEETIDQGHAPAFEVKFLVRIWADGLLSWNVNYIFCSSELDSERDDVYPRDVYPRSDVLHAFRQRVWAEYWEYRQTEAKVVSPYPPVPSPEESTLTSETMTDGAHV